MTMFLSQNCLVFLWVLVSIFIPNNSQPTFIYNYCLDPSNSTDEANFQSNLTSLLDSLSSKSAIYSFYNDSISSSLYGLFLCRGDVSSDTCQNCTKIAIQETKTRCGPNTTAITWYDECMLRYSKDNFFGQPETMPELLMFDVHNTTTPDLSDIDATSLVYPLIKDASLSAILFNASKQEGGGSQVNYGLVQCTRDLDSSSCVYCLNQLMTEARECCQQKIGWRVLGPSCYIRYENYSFFASPAPAPAPAPDGTAPAPGGGRGGGGKNTAKIILATVIPTTVVGIMVGFLYHLRSCKKRQRSNSGLETSGEILLMNLGLERSNSSTIHLGEQGMNATNEHDNEVHYFSLITIKAATSNFSDENKLGEGGFGPVYKGKLANGKEIAVKRLSLKSRQGFEEFNNEVTVIARLQHRNLVRLLGCCLEENEMLLVYEYMINTSLDAFLFDPQKRKELDWPTRAKVIHGIARGILYLHEDSRLKIIHRDLKASNVLLDEEMNPKISDFGTARIFGGKEIEANTNRVVGTYGYMAPEYALEGLFSIKSDAYSFGVLLLEIISGKKNNSFYEPDHAQGLLSYAWKLWSEGRGLELVDPEIVNGCQNDEAMRWIHIGMLCVQDDPNDRPTMSSVVLMLGSNINLPTPSASPFSAARFLASDQSSSTGHDARFLTFSTAST